jgi:hypothetical protein
MGRHVGEPQAGKKQTATNTGDKGAVAVVGRSGATGGREEERGANAGERDATGERDGEDADHEQRKMRRKSNRGRREDGTRDGCAREASATNRMKPLSSTWRRSDT